MKALNILHQSHDLHAYEAMQFALHDTDLHRTMACGIAGLSHVADSLSAIKHSKVRVVPDDSGLITGYVNEGGAFPRYGNNDSRADDLAVWAAQTFMAETAQTQGPGGRGGDTERAHHHLQRRLWSTHRGQPGRAQGG